MRSGKGHGRISADAAPSSTSLPSGTATPTSTGEGHAHRARTRDLKTGKRSIEVTWSLTSLGAERAGPEELLELVRNHWHIENRLHYVRDFTSTKTDAGPTCVTCPEISPA